MLRESSIFFILKAVLSLSAVSITLTPDIILPSRAVRILTIPRFKQHVHQGHSVAFNERNSVTLLAACSSPILHGQNVYSSYAVCFIQGAILTLVLSQGCFKHAIRHICSASEVGWAGRWHVPAHRGRIQSPNQGVVGRAEGTQNKAREAGEGRPMGRPALGDPPGSGT